MREQYIFHLCGIFSYLYFRSVELEVNILININSF